MSNKNDKNKYQLTLNLPKTDFSLRANASQKEPEVLEKWESQDLYHKTYELNKENKKFIMHDGPPYANGPIHMGHALNKILKDIVCKSKRMAGFYTPFKPGWDCHGLPIELKVAAEKKIDKNSPSFDKVKFKKSCREYAKKWIEVQKSEFKQLGVLAKWDDPYITMSPEYESSILKAFAKFVQDGFIERKSKTITWCASCQTVLAAAEIEYKDRKDPSTYILFSLNDSDAKKLFPDVFQKNPNIKTNLLIWTTTPWTIPLNRAVVLKPDAKYVLLQGKDENLAFVVAKDLADKVCQTLGIEKKVLMEFDSQIFENFKVNHPIVSDLQVPILLDDTVLLDEGTACLHSAPGCGPEDYLLGTKYGLEIYSPISPDGKYTQEIKPQELQGMPVVDGQIWVIKKLHESGNLLHKGSITHSYPHCWRCHKGLIFRATDQWFCNLQKNNLVANCTKEAEKIKFIPDWGKTRFLSFIGGRTEWCISRQREWGVPITGVLCKECGNAHLDYKVVNGVANKVANIGIEYWDGATPEKLIEDKILDKNFKCEKCGNSDLNKFELERDILDVWFDSGISHYAVLAKDKDLRIPADLYLEGSDQHRGWFQSSLFCSMVLNGFAQTRQILTHGFTVDEKGYKMSKSLGNVIAPQDIMQKLSRDILRLWVCSADYERDVVVSDVVFKNVTGVYRKIRNTCRFMISNLYDFDITKDAIEFDKLLKVDSHALSKLMKINDKIRQSYNDYNFASVFHALNNYCTNDLSSCYLDIAKDRLYVEKADGILRRSAQTVLYNILDTITRLMAPVLSFLSEEVSDFYQNGKKESIHLQSFPTLVDVQEIAARKVVSGIDISYGLFSATKVKILMRHEMQWEILQEVRQVVLKAIEEKRAENIVKHSLESKLTLYLDPENEKTKEIQNFIKDLQSKEDVERFFKDWFIVSQFEFAKSKYGLIQSSLPWVFAKVEHAGGVKCPRCWQWSQDPGNDNLCPRCLNVLGNRIF